MRYRAHVLCVNADASQASSQNQTNRARAKFITDDLIYYG